MASHLLELDLSFWNEKDDLAIEDQPHSELVATEKTIEPIADVAAEPLAKLSPEVATDGSIETWLLYIFLSIDWNEENCNNTFLLMKKLPWFEFAFPLVFFVTHFLLHVDDSLSICGRLINLEWVKALLEERARAANVQVEGTKKKVAEELD